MLSHPATPELEEAAVAADDSLPCDAAENPKRFPNFGPIDREFFRNWFIEGPLRTLKGRFSDRAAAFMIVGAMPAILGALFLTVPGFLFQTPQHHEFFYFAKIVEGDSASSLPMLLGAISSLFSFRFPLGA